MDSGTVQKLKNWFYFYVNSFASDDPEFQRNIDLKEQHTRRVCQNALNIGKDLGLNDDDLCLAEITALFHDIGRFEQYARYKTFSDRASVNHAAFGVEILQKNKVLDDLAAPLQAFILKVIGYHNQAALPADETERCLFFSKLLRDADKLDIWRVVTAYYEQKDTGETNETIELDLPDTPGISTDIYESLIKGQTILFDSMKNLNDFKLLQVGWVYDVNFLATLNRLENCGYLKLLKKALPQTEEIGQIFAAVESYMQHQIDNKTPMIRKRPMA